MYNKENLSGYYCCVSFTIFVKYAEMSILEKINVVEKDGVL